MSASAANDRQAKGFAVTAAQKTATAKPPLLNNQQPGHRSPQHLQQSMSFRFFLKPLKGMPMNKNTEPRLRHREETYSGGAVIGGVWVAFYLLLAFWSFTDNFSRDPSRQPIALSQAGK